MIGRASSRIGGFIDSNPRHSFIKTRVQAMMAPFQPVMSFRDVTEAAAALKAANLNFWFAGGWGIDILVGRQTREHRDLDIVIEDSYRDEPLASRALARLGYVHREDKAGGVWMPSVVALRDWSGRRIELMTIDWGRFAVESGLNASSDTHVEVETLRERAFTEGVICDRKLPCLSRMAPLTFHSNFSLADKHRQDLDILGKT